MTDTVETQATPVDDVTTPTPAESTTQNDNPAPLLGTFELLRTPGAADDPVTSPDDDVTAFVLSRTRRSVWDL